MAEFPDEIPEGCSQELAQYLKVNPRYWNEINPTSLEKLVADIFRANYSQCEVIHVGKPNDGGVDVIFIESNEKKWLIQVKRREKEKKAEGIATIRNLLGAMLLDQSKYGVVVSTSDHFSYWANVAKNNAKSLGYTLELVDKGKLNRLINPLLPNRQWVNLIKSYDPEWVIDIEKQLRLPDPRQKTIIHFIQQII